MLTVYRVILSFALPLLALRFVWRALRGREGWSDLAARFGLGPVPAADAVWLHGASVGEIASARPVVEGLVARGLAVHVTANTVTGRDRSAGWGLHGVSAAAAPFDYRWAQGRLLSRASVLVVMENELWPNRLIAAHGRGLPVVAIGARMSEASARGWARWPALAAQVLRPMAAVSAQDAGSRKRFAALGVAEARMLPVLDLKALYDPPAVDPGAALPGWTRSETVLFASTHEGEEQRLIAAFAAARKQREALRLILAPRHAERGPAVARLVQDAGLDAALRSRGEAPDRSVYIADTMAEMPLWYEAAGVTFVGGSLTDRGGHTPFEPAAHGTAILHGPDVANFAASYAALDAGGGALEAATAEDIAAALLAHVAGSPLPERAREVLAPPGSEAALVERIAGLAEGRA